MTKLLKGETAKEVCGACGEGFATEQEYLEHKCSVTKKKPTDFEHVNKLSNGRFARVSASAQERGEKKKEE